MSKRNKRSLVAAAALLGMGASGLMAAQPGVPTRIQRLSLTPLAGVGASSSLTMTNYSAIGGGALEISINDAPASLILQPTGALGINGVVFVDSTGLGVTGASVLTGSLTQAGPLSLNATGNATTTIGNGNAGGSVNIESASSIGLSGATIGVSSTQDITLVATDSILIDGAGLLLQSSGPVISIAGGFGGVDISSTAGAIDIIGSNGGVNISSLNAGVTINGAGGINLAATIGPLNLSATSFDSLSISHSGTGNIIIDPGFNSDVVIRNIDDMQNPGPTDHVLYLTASGVLRASDGTGLADEGIEFSNGQYLLGGGNAIESNRVIGLANGGSLAINTTAGVGSFSANVDSLDLSSSDEARFNGAGMVSVTSSTGVLINAMGINSDASLMGGDDVIVSATDSVSVGGASVSLAANVGSVDIASAADVNLDAQAQIFLSSVSNLNFESTSGNIDIQSDGAITVGSANGNITLDPTSSNDIILANVASITPAAGDVPLFLTSSGQVRVGSAGGFADEGMQYNSSTNQFELGGNSITASRAVTVDAGATLNFDGQGSVIITAEGSNSISSLDAVALSGATTLNLNNNAETAPINIGNSATTALTATSVAFNIDASTDGSLTAGDELAVGATTTLTLNGGTETGAVEIGNSTSGAVLLESGSNITSSTSASILLNGDSETGTVEIGNTAAGTVSLESGANVTLNGVADVLVDGGTNIALRSEGAISLNSTAEAGTVAIGNTANGGNVSVGTTGTFIVSAGVGQSSITTADGAGSAALDMQPDPNNPTVSLGYGLGVALGGLTANGTPGAELAIIASTDGNYYFQTGYDVGLGGVNTYYSNALAAVDYNSGFNTTTFDVMTTYGNASGLGVTYNFGYSASLGYPYMSFDDGNSGDNGWFSFAQTGTSNNSGITFGNASQSSSVTLLSAPGVVSSYEFPDASPANNGDVLTSDMAGKMSWQSPAASIFHARGLFVSPAGGENNWTINDANIQATDIVVCTPISAVAGFVVAVTAVQNGSFSVQFSGALVADEGFYYMVIPQ